MDQGQSCFALIRNIPADFRSKDLRIFFSSFVEQKRFECFHFKHRPEIKISRQSEDPESQGIASGASLESEISTIDHPSASDANTSRTTADSPTVGGHETGGELSQVESASTSTGMIVSSSSVIPLPPTLGNTNVKKRRQLETCCCVVKFSATTIRDDFIKEFNGKRWTTAKGDLLPFRCFVTRVKIDSDQCGDPDNSNRLNTDPNCPGHSKRVINESDIQSMPELKPASLMPWGNVGTPTQYFLEQIEACRLPPAVIKKLGLAHPENYRLNVSSARSKSGYRSVGFEYTDTKRKLKSKYSTKPSTSNSSNADLDEDIEKEILEKMNPPDTDDRSQSPNEDNDECEEWERHEALHDDVTTQDRTKPIMYEEEMEVVWEKGGPGLVFYTDDFHWEEAGGGDTDEKWADDWDVDMEVYYDPNAGDKDARDSMQIRNETAILSGNLETSVFKKPTDRTEGREAPPRNKGGRRMEETGTGTGTSGDFEEHTKGIGRKIMQAHGWKEGEGLGGSRKGKAYPVALDVELNSQKPTSHKGLGYKGVKLQRFNLEKQHKKRLITTVYDNPQDTDPSLGLHRRKDATWNKHSKLIKSKK